MSGMYYCGSNRGGPDTHFVSSLEQKKTSKELLCGYTLVD